MPGRKRDGITGKHAHQQAADASGEAGGGGDSRNGEACFVKNRRIHEDDVRHGDERC